MPAGGGENDGEATRARADLLPLRRQRLLHRGAVRPLPAPTRPVSTRAGAPISTSWSPRTGRCSSAPAPRSSPGRPICGWCAGARRLPRRRARHRRVRRQGADPRSSAGDHADPRLPRARPSDRQARPAGPRPTTTSTPSSTTTPTASPTPTSIASSTSTSCWAWRRPRCARSWRSCSKTYSGTVGIEFMHIQDPEQKAWIQARIEGTAGLFSSTRRGEARDPRAPDRDRGLRAVPARQVPRHQALRPRRRRERHPGAGDDHPHRRRARRRGDRDRHAAPRPAQRAGQRDGQALRRDPVRVPGQGGDRRGAGLGRRQVPSGHLDRPGAARRPHDPPLAHRQPLAPRGGQPGGDGQGARQADAEGRHRAHPRDRPPDARRRRVHRPGRGARMPADDGPEGLPRSAARST